MPHPTRPRPTRSPHPLDARPRHRDPRFTRGPETGRPPPGGPRGRRGAWALLAASVVMLTAGAMLPQGLLLASGLVAAGMAVQMLTPPEKPEPPRPRLREPARPDAPTDRTPDDA
ncbi:MULTISPECIES: hypothetical protein [Streptomyces]|uniref:hypothetical protein n=1 Tax=Streptomyces TaxID=1883 RepID=UPI001ABF2FA4|nr:MULTISPECIES: hypothetical protein [Streptomyces]MCF2535972.1 hypothetical protein [Streptomyces sp. FB2]